MVTGGAYIGPSCNPYPSAIGQCPDKLQLYLPVNSSRKGIEALVITIPSDFRLRSNGYSPFETQRRMRSHTVSIHGLHIFATNHSTHHTRSRPWMGV